MKDPVVQATPSVAAAILAALPNDAAQIALVTSMLDGVTSRLAALTSRSPSSSSDAAMDLPRAVDALATTLVTIADGEPAGRRETLDDLIGRVYTDVIVPCMSLSTHHAPEVDLVLTSAVDALSLLAVRRPDLLEAKLLRAVEHALGASAGRDGRATGIRAALALQLLQSHLIALVAGASEPLGQDTVDGLDRIMRLAVRVLAGERTGAEVRTRLRAEVIPTLMRLDRARNAGRAVGDWCRYAWGVMKQKPVEGDGVGDFWVGMDGEEEEFEQDEQKVEGSWWTRERLGLLCRCFDYFFGLVAVPLDEEAPRAGGKERRKKGKNRRKGTDRNAVAGADDGPLTQMAATRSRYAFQGVEAIGVDLRQDVALWELIQEGLTSADASCSKYALFLLKRVVDFSALHHVDVPAAAWSPLFSWNRGSEAELTTLWTEYAGMVEVVQSADIHLIEPVMGRFNGVVNASGSRAEAGLHRSWWVVLMKRGVSNRLATVRKSILEFIMADGPAILNLLTKERDFVYEWLLPRLDQAALFTVAGLGMFVSPFGEKVSTFVSALVVAFEDADRTAFVSFLFAFLPSCDSRIAALYLLMGLEDAASRADLRGAKCIGPAELERLRWLLQSERSVSVWTALDARLLLRRLLLSIIHRLSITTQLTFDDVSQTLAAICDTLANTPTPGDPDHAVARAWLHLHDAPGDADLTWFASGLRDAVDLYLNAGRSSLAAHDHDGPSAALARLLTFLIDPRSPDVTAQQQLLAAALSPLASRLDRIETGSMYASPGTVDRALALLAGVLRAVGPDMAGTLMPGIVAALAGVVRFCVGMPVMAEAEVGRARWDAVGVACDVVALAGSLAGRTVGGAALAGASAEVVGRWFADGWRILWVGGEETARYQLEKYAGLRMLKVSLDLAAVRGVKGLVFPEDAVVVILEKSRLRKVLDTVEDRNSNRSEHQNTYQTAQFDLIRSLHHYLVLANTDNAAASRVASMAFEICLDALPSATHMTAPPLLEAMMQLLESDSVAVSASTVSRLEVAAAYLVEDNWTNAKRFLTIIEALAGVLFSKAVLGAVAAEEGVAEIMERVFRKFVEWGEIKSTVVALVSDRVLRFWRGAVAGSGCTPKQRSDAVRSMSLMRSSFLKMLLWGPLWDMQKDERRMDAAISAKLRKYGTCGADKEAREDEEMAGTAEFNSSSKDYIVRVKANNILMRLDPEVAEERELALALLKEMLSLHGSFKAFFAASFEHRQQIRLWCSIHLLLDHVRGEEAGAWLERVFNCIEFDTIIATRYYIEWAAVRLLILNPDCLPMLWSRLAQYDKKSFVICSLLVIASHLSRFLPPDAQPSFHATLFPNLMPWLTTNHFSLRLYTHLAIHISWRHCLSSPTLRAIAESSPIAIPAAHMVANPESVKARRRVEGHYFLGGEEDGFDPIRDVNVEFIFRGGLVVTGVTEEERISGRAFERVEG
ncbi:Tar (HIV-1) RNA binding protein 1, partial [Irineochytrium annulatum]